MTFGLSGFALAVTLSRTGVDIRSRRRNTGENAFDSTRRLFRANPRRYGGYVAHLGVLLAVVGIAASQSYVARASATLQPGGVVSVDGYTVRYLGFKATPQSNRMVLQANLQASRADENLGVLSPSLNFYTTMQQPVVTPAVSEQPWDLVKGVFEGQNPFPAISELFHGRNPFEDLYIVLQGIDARRAGQHEANRQVLVQVLVNPMVGMIWMGGFLLGLGGVVALLPAARRRRVPVLAAEPARRQVEEVTA